MKIKDEWILRVEELGADAELGAWLRSAPRELGDLIRRYGAWWIRAVPAEELPAQDPDRLIREAVARHPECPPEALAGLARDPSRISSLQRRLY